MDALEELHFDLADEMPVIPVNSELNMPNGQKYRASPHYFGKSWYDWALYQFPAVADGYEEPIRPVHIRCFVDLSNLQPGEDAKYAPGIYFIAETVRLHPSREEVEMSSVFVPYLKLEGNNHTTNKTEFLEASRIIGPVCVIPDLDNTNKRAFLAVRPMESWASMFEEWINEPHLRNHSEPVLD